VKEGVESRLWRDVGSTNGSGLTSDGILSIKQLEFQPAGVGVLPLSVRHSICERPGASRRLFLACGEGSRRLAPGRSRSMPFAARTLGQMRMPCCD